MADLSKETPKIVNFDYIKSSNFRVAHVDGAYMASSTAGLAISFFAERHPIPRRVVHNIVEGKLGAEIPEQRVIRDAVVRDVEICFTMTVEAAKIIHQTLGQVIEQVEKARADFVAGAAKR